MYTKYTNNGVKKTKFYARIGKLSFERLQCATRKVQMSWANTQKNLLRME